MQAVEALGAPTFLITQTREGAVVLVVAAAAADVGAGAEGAALQVDP